MLQETQSDLLCAIAELVLSEKSGNWGLYAAYRPVNGKDDLLTKENECWILDSNEEVEAYLSSRVENYDPEIGMFIDVCCENVDSAGELVGDMDWCHVGFAADSMDLIIDSEVLNVNLVINDFNLSSVKKVKELLEEKVYLASDGYAPFIES
ncbi:hypothetical protein [Photobacterium damselae]|uniref:hypothetical protein n=1 Tax=Photobacterium damselae TaxID=38293 RepID=UPI001F386B4D|nr:hypothetical protein [Photobacterium damselae]UKA04833.1 hypothetical protein IHC89_21560 [Photobacterium damselae subsp. damselae]